jgi:hypothetical protein
MAILKCLGNKIECGSILELLIRLVHQNLIVISNTELVYLLLLVFHLCVSITYNRHKLTF